MINKYWRKERDNGWRKRERKKDEREEKKESGRCCVIYNVCKRKRETVRKKEL